MKTKTKYSTWQALLSAFERDSVRARVFIRFRGLKAPSLQKLPYLDALKYFSQYKDFLLGKLKQCIIFEIKMALSEFQDRYLGIDNHSSISQLLEIILILTISKS